jgi:hypothetical protein
MVEAALLLNHDDETTDETREEASKNRTELFMVAKWHKAGKQTGMKASEIEDGPEIVLRRGRELEQE